MAENELIIRVKLDLTAFDTGRAKVVRDAETTEARINQIGAASSAVTAKQAEAAANAKIREQQKAAREVERINSQTARQADQTDRLIERSAKQLADYQIKEAKRGATALIAEIDRTKAAQAESSGASSLVQGIAFGGGAGVALAAVQIAVGAAKEVVSLSAQGVTGLFNLAQASSDFGSKIFDASQKVSLTAESLSTVKLAADISGSSLDDFTGGFIKFEKNLAEAAHGNETLGKTFRALGVDVQAGVRDPEAALSQFLATFNKLPEGADRAAVATALYGKGAANLIPTFLELGGNFDAAKEKAEKLGLTFDSNAAAAADKFGDTLDTVKKQLTGVGYTIGTEFEPIFTDALSEISKALADNKDEIKLWATTGADFVSGFASGIAGFESTAETVLDNVNNRLRDYGTSVSDIYNKLKAINSTLPLPLQSGIFDIVDNAEKITAQGAADRALRETLARGKAAREQLANNKINFATGKVVGDGPDLSFLGGDEAAKKALEQAKHINDEAVKLALVFSELSTKAAADNPFVRIFNEGDSAMARFRKELKGVSPEIQKVFTDLQEKVNFKNLFSARLDASLSAFDLRDRASQFRDANTATANDSRFFTTADFLKFAQKIPDAKQFLGDNNQFKSDADRASFAIKYLRGDLQDPVQKRLNSQLDIINNQVNSVNRDPNALAIADKSLLRISSGINPNDVTATQREAIAGANEREAVRIETNEKAAQKERIDQTAALKSLVADQKELLGLLKSGKAKVDIGETGGIEVNLVDGSKSDITPQNQPTPQPRPLGGGGLPLGGTYGGSY